MSEQIEIINVKLVQATLGNFQGGAFSYFLVFQTKDGNQHMVGGDQLDDYDPIEEKRVPHPYCGLVISRILETLEVDRWEGLPSTYARLQVLSGSVIAIGNILKENWFYPAEEGKMLLAKLSASNAAPFVEVVKAEQMAEAVEQPQELKQIPSEDEVIRKPKKPKLNNKYKKDE